MTNQNTRIQHTDASKVSDYPYIYFPNFPYLLIYS